MTSPERRAWLARKQQGVTPPPSARRQALLFALRRLTGRDGGKLGLLAQLNIQVSVPHMGRIEDAHMVVCHMIAYHFMDS